MLQSHPQPAYAAYPHGTSLPFFAERGTRVFVKDSSIALVDRRPEEPTLAILGAKGFGAFFLYTSRKNDSEGL